MKKQWAAVVLAGGAGRRLGGRDKTKLAYREQESFLENILKEEDLLLDLPVRPEQQ